MVLHPSAEDHQPAREDVLDPVDPVALSSFLATVPELGERLPVERVERIGQGQSNLTFRVHLAGTTVILRRPPLGPLPPKAHDVLREFRVMNALRESEVPVPRLVAGSADEAIIGAPFFLMEDLPGDAIRSSLPPAFQSSEEAPRLISEGAIDTLAALHTIDPAKVGLDTLSRPTGYIARQIALWKRQLDYARVRSVPDLDWASSWLERHMPPDVPRSRLVHGDYKLDNLIFSRDLPVRVLGVVDWEMAALGDPLADLGWLLAFWCEAGTPPQELSLLPRLTEDGAFLRRRELSARYAERVASSLPSLSFYVVLALWKMAVLLEGHWARHVRRTAHAFDFAYLDRAGPMFHAYIRRTAEECEGVAGDRFGV
jgi:aminoglycoside phosphotransferase (APT) family kinase protein